MPERDNRKTLSEIGLNRTRQAERELKNGVKYPCTTVKIT